MDLSVTMTHMITVNNGYMYWFQFSGAKGNEFFDDFVSMLSSVKYLNQSSETTAEKNINSNQMNQFSLGNILFALLITIAIYSLPIIIYRYVIRKKPTEAKTAKKITIIYGICAFIVMSVTIIAINGNGAAGGAILLWSCVNYRVLIGGKADNSTPMCVEDASFQDNAAEIGNSVKPDEQNCAAPSIEQEQKVCTKCGTSLPAESKFCHKCGANLQQ